MAPVPDVAPADAAAVAPVPAVAPADAPHAPAQADAPAPAQAAAARLGLERRYMVPAAVAGATRDVPTARAAQPAIPYLGGRWTARGRNRCTLCPSTFHWRGKYKCEMPECGHRDVCIHHSFILCQNCFVENNN